MDALEGVMFILFGLLCFFTLTTIYGIIRMCLDGRTNKKIEEDMIDDYFDDENSNDNEY